MADKRIYAESNYSFKRDFELDEENIRKIYSLIKVRLDNNKLTESIIFEITRIGAEYFTTSDIDVLLNEDNDSTSRIIKIKIKYSCDRLLLMLSFDKKDGCDLFIRGNDRDLVFLLSSDLKEYINKEVANMFIPKERITQIYSLTIPLIAFTLFSYTQLTINNTYEIEELIQSDNINNKLNYLISEKTSNIKQLMPFLLFPIGIFLIMFFPLKKILNFFYPTNIFYFGKQTLVLQKRRKLSSNLFWGVVITFIISIIVTKLPI